MSAEERSGPTPNKPEEPTEPANKAASQPGKPLPSRSYIPANEKWLWVDPLESKEEPYAGGVLLAEEIKQYVDHDLLIKKEHFEAGHKHGAKLKGASYTMTPHPAEAWTLKRDSAGTISEVLLNRGKDSDGEYYIVPKNSLVFIKLRQELRIPFYMIGRHNLKIRYVYKGLLLGTGPQVDPGYVGNLIIPLHNFTTADVFIHIETSFVSIDFVRTSRFFRTGEKVPETIDELYRDYERSKSLIEREKVERRKTLAKYLEGSKPQSQMGQFEYDFERLKQDTKKELVELHTTEETVKKAQAKFESDFTQKWERSRRWKQFELIAVVGVFGLLMNAYRLQERDTETRGMDLHSTVLATNIATFERSLEKSDTENKAFKDATTSRIDAATSQTSTSLSILQTNLTTIDVALRSLNTQMASLTNNLQKAGLTNLLKGL